MNYKKVADALLQEWCRATYSECEMCGKPMACCHHYHTKGASSALRYVEDNLIPVCNGCHLGFHSKRAGEFNSRVVINRGVDWAKKLLKLKNNYVKTNVKYYKDIISKYEKYEN